MFADELRSEDVWNKVERRLADYLKNNSINMDAFDLTDKLEWPVEVRLKRSFDLTKRNFLPVFLEVTVLVDDKKKGGFTIQQRKKKREIIEENRRQVNTLRDVCEEKRRRWSKRVKMQHRDGKND